MRKKIIFIITTVISISSLLDGMNNDQLPTPTTGRDNGDLLLDLGGMQLSVPLGSSSSRTPITGVNQMDQLSKARSIARSNTHNSESNTRRNGPTVSDIDNKIGSLPSAIIPDIVISQPNGQPNGLQELFIDEKSFQKEWEQLELTNPGLYRLGRENNMPFENVMMYAQLSRDFHIEPEGIVEFVRHRNQLNNKSAEDYEIKHFEQLRKKDPEKYRLLELKIMKEWFDKEDGQEDSATVHNEHIVLQDDQIANQQGCLKKFTLGSILHTIFTVAIAGWAMYAQIQSRLPVSTNTSI